MINIESKIAMQEALEKIQSGEYAKQFILENELEPDNDFEEKTDGRASNR